MYTNNNFRIKIDLQLNNGIYIFEGESATGKTRLFNELRNIQKYEQSENQDKSIITYTYNDYLIYKISLQQAFDEYKESVKVIMLDRYDLYGTERDIERLMEISKWSIILIDCKQIELFSTSTIDKICFIEMTESSIKVTE